MAKTKIIIANWKMKLSIAESIELAKSMNTRFKDYKEGRVVICPDFVTILEVKKVLANSDIILGAQDTFWEERGSYTGEVSPLTLIEAGCEYVILGHSERRKFMMENYEIIHREINAVLKTDKLIPVICIGENWEERKTDRRDFVLYDQIQQALNGIKISDQQKIIVAYEPIWAIGSGTAIEPSEAEYAHKVIRITLTEIFGEKIVDENFQIVYGGSINVQDVGSFVDMEGLDGILVGGASLDAEEFYKVCQAITK
ncbi:MAG: triose-phosphate isomerase [Patescibacteria group bacterium]|nr:triose-phosphate isomerase [Patescibacteria group bacterium]